MIEFQFYHSELTVFRSVVGYCRDVAKKTQLHWLRGTGGSGERMKTLIHALSHVDLFPISSVSTV